MLNNTVTSFARKSHLHINEKGEQFYNVKWFGYPEEACTVEPAENIPDFIKDFYSDKNNIGKKLPNPKIRTSKKHARTEQINELCMAGFLALFRPLRG